MRSRIHDRPIGLSAKSGVLFIRLCGALVALVSGATCHPLFAGSGYVLSPTDKAVISALPRPRLSGIDLTGSCRNTGLEFADEKARAAWPAPSYGLPLRLWAISHAGPRAGTANPQCADMTLGVKLWQSAIGSPITGRLSKRDVSQFVRVVDAQDPRYVQAGHKGERVHIIPRAEREGGGGYEGSSSGTHDSVARVQLESVALLLGSSYTKLSRHLANTLCHRQGDTVVCEKQDPCYNYRARLGGMREIDDQGPRTKTIQDMGQGILNAIRSQDPRVREANRQDAATSLSRCQARYGATAQGSSQLSFAGKPVTRAELTFRGNTFVTMRMQAGYDPEKGNAGIGEYADAINHWMTSRMGKPKVETTTHTENWVVQNCYGSACAFAPGQNTYSHSDYTWRSSKHRMQVRQHGNDFVLSLQ